MEYDMALTSDDILGIAFAVALGCLIANDDGAFDEKDKAPESTATQQVVKVPPGYKLVPIPDNN